MHCQTCAIGKAIRPLFTDWVTYYVSMIFGIPKNGSSMHNAVIWSSRHNFGHGFVGFSQQKGFLIKLSINIPSCAKSNQGEKTS